MVGLPNVVLDEKGTCMDQKVAVINMAESAGLACIISVVECLYSVFITAEL